MIKDHIKDLRQPYRTACTRVWNAAMNHNVELAMAMGFFTSTDWQELANGEITDEALEVVMRDIAKRSTLQQSLRDETR